MFHGIISTNDIVPVGSVLQMMVRITTSDFMNFFPRDTEIYSSLQSWLVDDADLLGVVAQKWATITQDGEVYQVSIRPKVTALDAGAWSITISNILQIVAAQLMDRDPNSVIVTVEKIEGSSLSDYQDEENMSDLEKLVRSITNPVGKSTSAVLEELVKTIGPWVLGGAAVYLLWKYGITMAETEGRRGIRRSSSDEGDI